MRGLAILALGVALAGCGQVADAQAQLVETLRVKDAIGAYEAARTPTDRCVKAKLVAADYADARNLAESHAWEAREQMDCRAAATELGVTLPAKP